MAIAPLMQTSASGSTAAGSSASPETLAAQYEAFLAADLKPAQIMKQMDMTPEMMLKVQEAVAARSKAATEAQIMGISDYAKSFAAGGTASSRDKALTAFGEQESQLEKSGISGKKALDSLAQLEKDNAGATLFSRTLGPGLAPSLVRGAKTLLSGVVDVGAGDLTDLQNIDSSAIQGIADVAQGWSGAVSNFENQLFQRGAAGPDKTPEYNRAQYAAAIGTAAQVKVFGTMLTEVNNLRKDVEPLTPNNAMFSPNNRKKAMEWIAQQAGLPFDKLDPNGSNYEQAALAWEAYANNSDNAAQIREAILRVNQASMLGAKPSDDVVSQALGLANIVDPEAKSNAPPTTDLDQIDEATATAANADAAKKTATDAAIADSAGAQGTAEGLEQFATTDYADGKTALAAIQETLTATGKAPTSVKIKGRVVTLNSFADATAASKFIDDLKAANQPVPSVVIIGGQIQRVK